MGIRVPIRLTSVEKYIEQQHGEFRQLTLEERRILRRYAEYIVERVQQAWPVDTGRSRDGFTAVIEASKKPVQIVITNDVYYVQWVHYAGTPADDVLWRTLLPNVIKEVRDNLLAEIRAEVDRTEARLAAGRPTRTRGLVRLPFSRGARA